VNASSGRGSDMGITFDLKVETPLDDDDRDLLAGLSVMLVAVANRQSLTDQQEEEPSIDPENDAAERRKEGMN
jgi:hypothetical protein